MRPTTVRLSEATLAELDMLASAMDRDRSYLIAKAIESWLAEQREFVAAVQEGLREIDEGRGIPHEELLAEFGLQRTDVTP